MDEIFATLPANWLKCVIVFSYLSFTFFIVWRVSILRTFFEAEAETRIPPLVFASVMMLKPAFHRWRFKIVRTVGVLGSK